MKTAVLWALLGTTYAGAQTRPRPDQIRNIEQVRICQACGDDRAGTLVLSGQVQDGRYVDTPAWLTDPADAGQPTVCILIFYRVTVEGIDTGHNIESPNCYTQAGLALLIVDPTWLDWWTKHKP